MTEDQCGKAPSFRFCRPRVLMLLCTVLLSVSANAHYRVVGYYPYWMRGTLPAASVRFDGLTHVILAFAIPQADGSISAPAELISPELVAAAHSSGGKVLVALGGWGGSQGFAPMVADTAARRRFVANLVDLLATHNLDGTDIDWEYPATAAERANLVTLVRDLRAEFDVWNSSWLLTMAVPQGNWSGQWFDFPAMTPSVDWYNLMTYDTHGSWTNHAGHNCPLYAPPSETDGSVAQAVTYLSVTRGVPKARIVIGVPFYGKEFTADSLYMSSTACTDVQYSEIPGRLAAGWRHHWDDVSQVPYLTMPSFHRTLCFDDSLSVTIKAVYARDNGLGGVMIWALGQDVVGTTQPLMEAIEKAIQSPVPVSAAKEPAVPGRTQLLANYPNPFNPATTIRFQISADACVGTRRQWVKLAVFDVLGREVEVLVDEQKMPGRYEVQFDASGLAGGAYLCRMMVRSPDVLPEGTRRAERGEWLVHSQIMYLVR